MIAAAVKQNERYLGYLLSLSANALLRASLSQALTFSLSAVLWCSLAGQSAKADTLIYGGTVLTMADEQAAPFTGYVQIENNKISAIGPMTEVPSHAKRKIDASGKVIIPGFISGHNHLWQSAFRGIASDQALYGWLGALHWTFGDYFAPGDFYTFTLHGALDQLAHGITTTYNHSQRLGASEQLYIESFDAGVDSGQRFIFSYNANSDADVSQIEPSVEAFLAYVKLKGGPTVLGLSMNAVGIYRDNQLFFDREIQVARANDMTVQMHYLEDYANRELEQDRWSRIVQAKAVGKDVSYAHFIHTTDAILKQTAEQGGAMIWNPLSNGRLASGLPAIKDYLQRGIRVGLGVDGAASADIADPFENMRMGLYSLRMQAMDPDVFSPLDILRMHTLGTAAALGVDEQIGSLEVGKLADLLIVDLDQPVTGALFDLPASLVFSACAANIECVMVGGEIRASRLSPLNHDMSQLQAELKDRVRALIARQQKAVTE